MTEFIVCPTIAPYRTTGCPRGTSEGNSSPAEHLEGGRRVPVPILDRVGRR